MIKYKLTRQDNTTYKNTTWEIGVSKETNGKVKKLCTNSWLHFYHTPELAILLNPIHANIINSKLWECEVEGEILDNDYGLKAGCTKMTLLKEIAKPELSFKNLIQFAYLALSDIANFTDIAKVDNFIPDFLVLVKNYLKKDCVKPSKKLISGIKNLQKWFVEADKKLIIT